MSRLYPLAAAINAWVLVLILAGGFAVQLLTGELPCPLCVMQRIALMLCALGPLHILISARDSALTSRAAAVGNGMAIIAALLGAVASGRQVLLHILPGDPGFGAPVLGLHLYTWGLIAFICQIAASGVMLIAIAWLEERPAMWGGLARWTAIALAAIVVANLLSVIAEAGVHWGLPESPADYLMLGTSDPRGAAARWRRAVTPRRRTGRDLRLPPHLACALFLMWVNDAYWIGSIIVAHRRQNVRQESNEKPQRRFASVSPKPAQHQPDRPGHRSRRIT